MLTPISRLVNAPRLCTALQRWPGHAEHFTIRHWPFCGSRRLLQCLPVDLVVVENIGDEKRMRLLRLLRDLGGYILPEISQFLPDNLLPKLTGLFCDPLYFSFMALIFGSSLKKFQLHVETPPLAIFSPTLAQKCPLLSEIRIHEGWAGWEEMSPFLCNFRFLECVEAECLDWDTVYHLRHLTSLRTLELIQLPKTLPPLATPLFPALINLKISPDTSVRHTIHLLKSFEATPLVSFDVARGFISGTAEATPTALEWEALFSSLRSGCSHTSLDEILIFGWELDRVDVDKNMISSSTVRLLFCFANLTEVCIESGVGFDLDDDAVSDMARSWPRLTILELTAVASNVPPRVTLSGLCVFTQYCPHLRSLEIPFDASDVPNRDAVSEDIRVPTDHALTVLGAINCPIVASQPV